jgi:hypothetical protein
MLKLTRKNRRDFGCYSISKEEMKEKEREKKPLMNGDITMLE